MNPQSLTDLALPEATRLAARVLHGRARRENPPGRRWSARARRAAAAVCLALLTTSILVADEPSLIVASPVCGTIEAAPLGPGSQLQFIQPAPAPQYLEVPEAESEDPPGIDASPDQLVNLKETSAPALLVSDAPSSAPQKLPLVNRSAAKPIPPLFPKLSFGARGLFRLVNNQEDAADNQGSSDTSDQKGDKDGKGEKKEPQKFGREPESSTMQFLRTESVLLKPGAWQFDTGFAYVNFDNPFPAAILSGGNLTAVVPAHLRRRLVYSPLAFRYGLDKNVQLFGTIPLGFSNTQTSFTGYSQEQNSGGFGDLTAGATFHLFGAQCDYPDVLSSVAVTAPTGQYAVPIFDVVPGSALGQGFWALSASLLAINQYDPIVVYYGLGYRHLFQREFNGTPYAAGEQFSYMMGVGFAANDRVTLSATLQAFYITDFLINQQVVPGTNVEPVSMRFAATIDRRCKILEPWAAIGMTEWAPAFSLGITWTYY